MYYIAKTNLETRQWNASSLVNQLSANKSSAADGGGWRGGGGCSLDTQRIMAESECHVDEVTGGSESSELDYSLDLFFEEEEGPAIPEGPSDNNLPPTGKSILYLIP